ncbi:MAG: hypothetical protein ACOYU4_00235 [Thermodesulfobacteriota bacterium]
MIINDGEQKDGINSCPSGDGTTLDTVSTQRVKDPLSDPNAGTGDPTDGRKPCDWVTSYPATALKEIRWESIYLLSVLICSLFLIFANWIGWIIPLFQLPRGQALMLKKYTYYTSSGLLGGITFGIKYFYRVVARGYWHQDRKYWRIMSPFIAMTVALIIGAMIDASLINAKQPCSGAAVVSIGFLAGYFADQAVAKMYDIAIVLFGKAQK